MSDIVPFDFHGHRVRVVMIDGEPRWVIIDVSDVLGLVNSRDALKRLDPEDVDQIYVLSPQGTRQLTNVVNETGLYELIFRSDKPQAKTFRRWVTSEVLPEIRKTGSYNAIAQRNAPDELTQLAERSAAQARVLREINGIVDPKWLESKARQVAARAMGEEPEIDPDKRPITVGEYLDDQGITGRAQKGIASDFGKVLKRLYIQTYGIEPGQNYRDIDGASRKVFVYTERDRPLFDKAWAEMLKRKKID